MTYIVHHIKDGEEVITTTDREIDRYMDGRTVINGGTAEEIVILEKDLLEIEKIER